MYPQYCQTKSDCQAHDAGYIYDETEAIAYRQFVEKNCVMSSGEFAGQPRPMLDWHWDFARQFFSWKRPDGKISRWREAQLWIPRKNAKSWLDSTLCLWTAIRKKGGQVCIIASNVKQAKLVYDEICNMLVLGPLQDFVGKSKTFHLKRHINQIEYNDKDGFQSIIKVLSSNPNVSGFHYDLLCFDEFMEFPKSQSQIVWDRLKNGGSSRNGIRLISSTMQFDRSHIGYGKYQEAKQVLSGEKIDLTLLPVVYEVPEDGACICGKGCGPAWRCMEAVIKANPGAGITIPINDFTDDFQSVDNNPREEARWKTLRCNIASGAAEQWIASNVWAACGKEINEKDFHGMDATIGFDCSRRHDLTAYVVMVKDGDKVYYFPRAFIPEQMALHKIKTDNVRYDDWQRRGYVQYTSGDTIDFNDIMESLREDQRNFRIQEFRFDPTFMEYPRQTLEAEGFNCVEVSQSYAGMGAATAKLERMILDKTLVHPKSPAMDWCLQNCKVKIDSNDRILLDKIKCRNRIDIITACVISTTALLAEEEGDAWAGSWAAGW